jgi:hypothetical protein
MAKFDGWCSELKLSNCFFTKHLYVFLQVCTNPEKNMKKLLAAFSAATLIATSSTSAFAGGLNDAIVDNTVMPAAGPSSSFPIWIIIPIIACLVACGGNGTDDTSEEDPA